MEAQRVKREEDRIKRLEDAEVSINQFGPSLLTTIEVNKVKLSGLTTTTTNGYSVVASMSCIGACSVLITVIRTVSPSLYDYSSFFEADTHTIVFEIRSSAESWTPRSKIIRMSCVASKSSARTKRCTSSKTWSRPSKARC